ncbi:MAG TPA: DMT family transporter [Gemmatimonadales bacterium]|nr:DMT family transporter [Gemmatimonadales bacterium]
MSLTQRARLQLVAAAVLFSTGGAVIKATAMTSWQVASLRSGIAAFALALLLPDARHGIRRRTLLVSVAYAATLVLFVSANKLTTSANTIFLQATGPLYILLLAPWLLRERIRGADLAFMAVVAIGLVLFFVGTDTPVRTAPAPFQGNVLAALSGLTWALTLMGLRWMGADESGGSPAGAVVLGNALACLATLPMALPFSGIAAGDWGAILYLGLFQIALAYAFVTKAVGRLPALEISIILLIEPALNPVWSWLVHGERPGPWALAGGALILGATTLRSVLAAAARPVDASA